LDIIAADEGAATARFRRICGRELNNNLETGLVNLGATAS
jgi:hypothetical protein